MDDVVSTFIIICFGNPIMGEVINGSQYDSSKPGTLFPLRRTVNTNLHGGRRQGDHFFVDSVFHPLKHGAPSRQHDILIQVLPDVSVILRYCIETGVMDSKWVELEHGRLEQSFRALEPLLSHFYFVSIWEFVFVVEFSLAFVCLFVDGVIVLSDEAGLFFHLVKPIFASRLVERNSLLFSMMIP